MHPITAIKEQINELRDKINALSESDPFAEASYEEYRLKIERLEVRLKVLESIQKEIILFTDHFGVVATWLDEMVIVYVASDLYAEVEQFLKYRLSSQGKRIGYFADETVFKNGQYEIKLLFKLNETTVAQGDIEVVYYL